MSKKKKSTAANALALFGGPKSVTLAFPPYPVIEAEEVSAAVKVMMQREMSAIGGAGVVGDMERAFADYFGTRYAHAFNGGTAALHASLFAAGVGPGSEVLTASHTWISAICSIMHAGGTPVFCDTKKGEHYIDPDEIRRKAGPNTKAVIATHLWGHPADMDPIMEAARECKLKVVEDCSHAHGGKYKGQWLGTIGDMGVYSLQGSKSIVAGEGGIMLTNSKRFYERAMIPANHLARLITDLTLKELEGFREGGGAWTYRIVPTAAAIAIEQLKRLEGFTQARAANYERIRKHIRSIDFIDWPKLHKDSRRGFYGAPAVYRYDQKKVCRDLFVEACVAEGCSINGGGYENYYQVPLFQDTKLYGQMWPVEHANGVTYTPLPAGALVNNEAMRKVQLLFGGISPIPQPERMDQMIKGYCKVAANMDTLAAYQRKHRKKYR